MMNDNTGDDNDNNGRNHNANSTTIPTSNGPPQPDSTNSTNAITTCSWTPNNIPLLVENAQGRQWTVNLMNYVGTECVHYLSATTGEPRSKEERFADRVFLVGCYENTSASRKDILNPLIQQAIATAGFQVSVEKGFRYDNQSLPYYCTRFRTQRQGRKTGGKSGKFRNTTTTKPTSVAERCKFSLSIYWDEALHRWYVWPSGAGCACHSGHLPVNPVELKKQRSVKSKPNNGTKSEGSMESSIVSPLPMPPQQPQQDELSAATLFKPMDMNSITAATIPNPVLATAVLAASSASFLQPIPASTLPTTMTNGSTSTTTQHGNISMEPVMFHAQLTPADEELRQRMARNERNCHTELLPDFMEITSLCHDAVVGGNFQVFQHVRAAITKLKQDVVQRYFPDKKKTHNNTTSNGKKNTGATTSNKRSNAQAVAAASTTTTSISKRLKSM